MEHLSIKEIHDRLEELKDWELIGNGIMKDFSFDSHKQAMEFAQKIGEEAQRLNHYPDISIRNNKVNVALTTQEANGLTHDDFKMAKIIEQLV